MMEKYAQLNTISWRENYAIPNKAFGFVKSDNNETIGYVVTGYSDDIINKSTIDAVLFLLLDRSHVFIHPQGLVFVLILGS